MFNQVCIFGRLTQDPEIKVLENGTKVSNITLAVSRSYKNADGEYDTDFIKCAVWQNLAENIVEHCKSGDLVGIKGRIQSRKFENENGKHTELELIAEKVTFLSSSKNKNKSNEMTV